MANQQLPQHPVPIHHILPDDDEEPLASPLFHPDPEASAPSPTGTSGSAAPTSVASSGLLPGHLAAAAADASDAAGDDASASDADADADSDSDSDSDAGSGANAQPDPRVLLCLTINAIRGFQRHKNYEQQVPAALKARVRECGKLVVTTHQDVSWEQEPNREEIMLSQQAANDLLAEVRAAVQ